MNCATHNDIAAVAYCRTCGKPLCASCKRDVKGVIYCENCLAERLQGVQPPQTTYQPVVDPGVRAAPLPGSGPNPALAGILAAFFPFGVGAVYTGQYAKGLAHLLIFTGLVWGLSSGAMGNLEPVLGIGMAFFIVYRSEEHTSELQSQSNLVCRLLLEKKKPQSNIQNLNHEML